MPLRASPLIQALRAGGVPRVPPARSSPRRHGWTVSVPRRDPAPRAPPSGTVACTGPCPNGRPATTGRRARPAGRAARPDAPVIRSPVQLPQATADGAVSQPVQQLREHPVDAVGRLADVLEDDDGAAGAARSGVPARVQSIESVPPPVGRHRGAGGEACPRRRSPRFPQGEDRPAQAVEAGGVGRPPPRTGPATVGPKRSPRRAWHRTRRAVRWCRSSRRRFTTPAARRGRPVDVAPSARPRTRPWRPTPRRLGVEPCLLEVGGAGGVRRRQVRPGGGPEDVPRHGHLEAQPAQGRDPRSSRARRPGRRGRRRARARRERAARDARLRRRRGRLLTPRRRGPRHVFLPLAQVEQDEAVAERVRDHDQVPTGIRPGLRRPRRRLRYLRAACWADPTSHAGSYGRLSLSTISVPVSGSRRPAWPLVVAPEQLLTEDSR